MDEETTQIGEMWRIINKIEGYLDIDFTTLMIKNSFNVKEMSPVI
jgi:hypothetical protein